MRVGRVIAIANSKGGTGKTTTAVNLAVGLAKSLIDSKGEIKGRVLLIDLDPQGHVAHSLGIASHQFDVETNPDGSCVSFLIQGQQSLSSKADRARLLVWAHRPNEGLHRPNLFAILCTRRINSIVQMMMASDHIAQNDPALAHSHVYLRDALRERMGSFTDAFTYVIIDCPPNLGLYASMVYNYAPEVIVPVRADDLSMDGMVSHVNSLYEYKRAAKINTGVLFVVPTMVRPWQRMDQSVLQRLNDRFKGQVADPIPDLVSVKEAPGVGGQTVLEYDPQSPAAAAYTSLTKRVIRGNRA